MACSQARKEAGKLAGWEAGRAAVAGWRRDRVVMGWEEDRLGSGGGVGGSVGRARGVEKDRKKNEEREGSERGWRKSGE